MIRNKRLIIAVTLAALISGFFWSQSRIPALNEKAQMGLRTNFGEIAFEIVLPVTAEQSLPSRVFRSGVNWAFTNLQGMAFGLLFAAAILTILANLRSRQFRQPWLNSLAGIFVGAPLGVCVNCATPIAFGIYSAGARLETALASLVASPTLNAIVLTMSFALLPWEIAVAKLVGVALVLSCIPSIVRRYSGVVDTSGVNAISEESSFALPPTGPSPAQSSDENILTATVNTASHFAKNLWYLTRFALPLMILAGFLGALAIELVPFDDFTQNATGFGTMIAGAFLAVFLPVPIAFDVIIAMALLANGVDIGLATAMLFGLGIYSIYPAAMIARYISMRLSIAIGVAVAVIAIALGVSAQTYFEHKNLAERQLITAGLSQSGAKLYQEAIEICDQLPDHLQQSCFSLHIDDFEDIVSTSSLCTSLPSAVSSTTCELELQKRNLTRIAVSTNSTEPCNELTEASARSICVYNAMLKFAQRDRNIQRCNLHTDRNLIAACRNEYLNASLLFNPDDSACARLTGAELADCKVNAEIYRLADTADFGGCDILMPAGAREHCRYTIASTMIGRHNDPGGCARLNTPALSARCNNLVTAWEAERNESLDLCQSLPPNGLQDTCMLRVADRLIQAVLARSMLVTAEVNDSAATSRKSAEETSSAATTASPLLQWQSIRSDDNIDIAFARFSKSSDASLPQFTTVNARDLGISQNWNFRITDFFEPFIIGKGIASGDFNNDFWPDLVLASESGILLYRNIGGRYELAAVDQGELQDANIFLVAFVDFDNDGQQDIFASSYGGKNYLLENVDGNFEKVRVRTLVGDQRLTLSAAFGDLNRDGQMDFVLGNWSSGIEKLFSPEHSSNFVYLSDGITYKTQQLNEVKGETNSILLADINNDHNTDMLIGNDRLVPDLFYFGDENGAFKPLSNGRGVVPVTSMFTMSIESADFNNDLEADVFSTDMTFSRSSKKDYCLAIRDNEAKSHCADMLSAYNAFQEKGAGSCKLIENASDRQDCFVAFSIKAAKNLKDSRYCEALPGKAASVRSLCEYLAAPAAAEESIDQGEYLAQTQRNTLLLQKGDRFFERAETFGVDSSFWSWNAKAADLDNDGWQDIYVGNGFHFGDNFYEIQENILFRNVEGKRFEQMQSEWGLDDPLNTPSYTYTDLDLDGDIDIIATGVLAAPRVFINELATGHSVSIALFDERGNSNAIGAKVTIRYGGTERLAQRKENVLSGGFLSFNNPVLHFGTGDHTVIDEVTVRWPDGESTTVSGPLEASGIYRVRRLSR